MGDRTYVHLTVRKAQSAQAETLFSEEANEVHDDERGNTVYGFEEVNYGNLPFLHELRDAGIAHTSRWEDGDEYDKGTSYCRFTEDGDCIEQEIYDANLNPPLDSLMKLIDNPVQLRDFIIVYKKSITFAELDENQVEYGRRYLAKKLIAPA